MHNSKEYVEKKLQQYTKQDIIISEHAKVRMIQRQISLTEIIDNIINPKRLTYVIKDVNKFDCYFVYSDTLLHRYIMLLQQKIIIITVI